MDDFWIDARSWRFLDNPGRYLQREKGGLQVQPLSRQFRTAKEILTRLKAGRGVLLADDVGLGKTTIGALVAWIVACQDKRVRIYAPNQVLRRRWAEELTRHMPMLKQLNSSYGAIRSQHIRQGQVERLRSGSIQIATHHALITSHGNNEQRTACDLMIIDEAHRAKGDGSAFNDALHNLGDRAKRKLILTATPFSIRLTELEQLLRFVGASHSKLEPVRRYASDLKRLFSLGEGHDVAVESKRLVSAAKDAIDLLRPYLIRHGVDDLSSAEKQHFGDVDGQPWEIATPHASLEEIGLLLRMDRLLQLAPERKGERRNDPRFHTGWQHFRAELTRADSRMAGAGRVNEVALQHIKKAKVSLRASCGQTHPKIAAVAEAIRPVIDAGEKVLAFCHHRATASELLSALERDLRAESESGGGPPENVWRAAWNSLLLGEDPLVVPIIDWLCTAGLRRQVSRWLGKPASNAKYLARQLATSRPRSGKGRVATISVAAQTLTKALLEMQSTSTRALLKAISKGQHTFGGQMSHFPGLLDVGFRTMGAWDADAQADRPKTLYTGKPDIVLAIFNSPFGPDVLVATDRLSEGVDLHRSCRHLIHYELDPSPIRTLQRNGRVRRVGSWAAMTCQPIRYAYPTFGGTRDEKAVIVMKQRINAFGLLLGGVPSLDDDSHDNEQNFADHVLRSTRKHLESLNRKLCV